MLLLSPTPLPWEEENIAPCSIPTRKINGSHLKDISREKSVLTKNAAEELAALKSCLYDSKSPNVGSLTKPAAKRLKGRIFGTSTRNDILTLFPSSALAILCSKVLCLFLLPSLGMRCVAWWVCKIKGTTGDCLSQRQEIIWKAKRSILLG